MIYPNPFDGYKFHPENEFHAEDFTDGEVFAIQEVCNALWEKTGYRVGWRAKAFKDSISVTFYFYGDSKQYEKKVVALFNRKNWEWTVTEANLDLNDCFKTGCIVSDNVEDMYDHSSPISLDEFDYLGERSEE